MTDGVPQLADQATEVLIGLKSLANEDMELTLNETMVALPRAVVSFEGVLMPIIPIRSWCNLYIRCWTNTE